MTANAADDLRQRIGGADSVVPIGAGTHADLGGRVTDAVEVRVPAGIVDVQPSDMTVTVRAGTSFTELDAALGEHGQECPLDPLDPRATIGGIVAAGLSGWRRLGLGPLRDALLEVRFVTADGREVRGGGPTVKNVTGYDLPRLFVGSLGTLGVITQLILRTRPRPRASQWFRAAAPAAVVRRQLFAPTAVLADAEATYVLLEGDVGDMATETTAGALTPTDEPTRPTGSHRGRLSVDPARLEPVGTRLGAIDGIRWLAEHGVGTVHVASDRAADLAAARQIAESTGGWLLREAGAPDLDPFGAVFPAVALQRRIRQAVDPTGKLSPGRITATESR